MSSPLYQRLALFTATPAVDYRTKGKGRNVHYWTNLKNKGLISADRRTSLLSHLTIPCSVFKSSTKDLSFPIFGIIFQLYAILWCSERQNLTYRYTCDIRKGEYRRFPAWILT